MLWAIPLGRLSARLGIRHRRVGRLLARALARFDRALDRTAAAWAERRKIPQVAFGLDRRLGSPDGFRRNEQMLSLKARCLVTYSGDGVLKRLVIQAKEGIHSSIGGGPLVRIRSVLPGPWRSRKPFID
jgi:hypothetical protein